MTPVGVASPGQPLLPDMSKSGSHSEAVSKQSERLEHHGEKRAREVRNRLRTLVTAGRS